MRGIQPEGSWNVLLSICSSGTLLRAGVEPQPLQGLGLGMDLWQRVRAGAAPAPSQLWQRPFGAGFVPGTGSRVGCQPWVLIPSGFSAETFAACSRSCEQTLARSFVSKDKLSSLLVKEHLLTFTFHKTLSCSFFNHER